MTSAPAPSDSVSVAVVGICSADHLARCLEALEAQEGAPPFDVVVAYDPGVPDVEALAERFPDVRLVSNAGQRTPLELASRALREAKGENILLTEDHCVPRPDWVRTMLAAQAPGRAVVGGRVETREDATATNWAFYFVDFFRYCDPVVEGPSPTLTVCNAVYKKSQLAEIDEVWRVYFHETAANDALRQRFGDLWLVPDSEVTMARNVRFGAAIYERYAFGRLFGCTRIRFCSPAKRVFYAIFAPALPLILMGRMARKGLLAPRLRRHFLRSLGPLVVMAVWWSWGEWLGYLTGRHPSLAEAAPEIRAARRAAPPGSAAS